MLVVWSLSFRVCISCIDWAPLEYSPVALVDAHLNIYLKSLPWKFRKIVQYFARFREGNGYCFFQTDHGKKLIKSSIGHFFRHSINSSILLPSTLTKNADGLFSSQWLELTQVYRYKCRNWQKPKCSSSSIHSIDHSNTHINVYRLRQWCYL